MVHTEATINEAFAALSLLGGREGVKAILLARRESLPHLKYGEATLGQLLAGRDKLDDAVWDALLRGDTILTVDESGESAVITAKEKDRLLVDSNGRFIPSACGITAPVVDADWSRSWPRHDLDCAGSLSRLENSFVGLKVPISAADLQERAEKALAALTGDEQFANLVTGKHACYLVTVIPQMSGDYGTMLENCIGAVERSSLFGRPERKFASWWGERGSGPQWKLKGAVKIYPNSRHRQLVKRVAKGFVPGLFFPGCCQGFGTEAMFQLERNLPKKFWFCAAGGIDTCAAWAAKIEALVMGEGAPEQKMPAIWQEPTNYGIVFRQFPDGIQCGESYCREIAYKTNAGGMFLPI